MKNSDRKKILITFLGNIDFDTRCYNLYETFDSSGHEVEFIGFDWSTENFSSIKGKKTVYKLSKLPFSIFFYLKFYFLLNLKVLLKRFDVIFAEDLYCLPVCVVAAKIKRAKVIYDCRELFSFLAGLKNKSFIQKFWSFVENIFISKVDLILTTGEMDLDFINNRYNLKNILVIRNLPLYKKADTSINYSTMFKFDKSKKVLIYQGVILHGRGLKMTFDFLKTSDDFVLVIIGGGELLDYYRNLANKLNLLHKVFFIGKIPQEELHIYTSGAFVGLSLIENLSLSYQYALPNKLFEYIMAEIPVVVTSLPQMKKIVENYQVGFVVEENDLDQFKKILYKLKEDNLLYSNLKTNCRNVSRELCWENEIKKLLTKI